MSLTIDERLRLELERTSLRRLARTLPDVDAWARAVRVMNWAKQARLLVEDRYAHDRERRIAEEQRLVHAAGAPQRHLVPRWAAVDRFDSVRTREQAERIVRERHGKLLARIDRIETSRLRPLVQEAQGQLGPGLTGVFELNARPGPRLVRKGPDHD